MIAGLPALAGALQLTSRLSVVLAVAVTVGTPGAAGGSSSSVTLMVTATVSLPPLPSSALTVTA